MLLLGSCGLSAALCGVLVYLLTRRYYREQMAWIKLELSNARSSRESTASNALFTISLLEKRIQDLVYCIANNKPAPAVYRMSILEARLAEIRSKQAAHG